MQIQGVVMALYFVMGEIKTNALKLKQLEGM